MANKRVLDLAKDLGVTADDVQRAAVSCGVAAEGPTASLDSSDVAKVKATLKSNEKKSAGGSKTLTLGKPLSLGGKSSGESGNHSIEVSVRRRRSRTTGSATVVAKPTIKPADQARQAVESSAERKKVAAPVVTKPIVKAPSTTETSAKKIEVKKVAAPTKVEVKKVAAPTKVEVKKAATPTKVEVKKAATPT
ncbi:MAG: hypothetical protein Q9N02_03285, partial [Ghiorsea sp.]|nr:hypothetical protein [Ghiorsea sp.]